MTRTIALMTLCLALTACASNPPPEPQIITKTVDVAVPEPCVKPGELPQPPYHLMTYGEVRSAVLGQIKAGNTAAATKVAIDQLLLWLAWGPQLEAVAESCSKLPAPAG